MNINSETVLLLDINKTETEVKKTKKMVDIMLYCVLMYIFAIGITELAFSIQYIEILGKSINECYNLYNIYYWLMADAFMSIIFFVVVVCNSDFDIRYTSLTTITFISLFIATTTFIFFVTMSMIVEDELAECKNFWTENYLELFVLAIFHCVHFIVLCTFAVGTSLMIIGSYAVYLIKELYQKCSQ